MIYLYYFHQLLFVSEVKISSDQYSILFLIQIIQMQMIDRGEISLMFSILLIFLFSLVRKKQIINKDKKIYIFVNLLFLELQTQYLIEFLQNIISRF